MPIAGIIKINQTLFQVAFIYLPKVACCLASKVIFVSVSPEVWLFTDFFLPEYLADKCLVFGEQRTFFPVKAVAHADVTDGLGSHGVGICR